MHDVLPRSTPAASRAGQAAAFAFACMLIVIAASAYLRLSTVFPPLLDGTLAARGAHRVAASLAGMAVLWLGILAYRREAARPAAGAALALTAFLALLGGATGSAPPPAAALSNLLGGLSLAVLLAWAHVGAARTAPVPVSRRFALAVLGAACIQAVLGAWMGTRPDPVEGNILLAHLLLGVVVALLAGWLGVRLAGAGSAVTGWVVLALAGAVPLAGVGSAFLEPSAELAVVHPISAALLLAVLARVSARGPAGLTA